MTLHNHAQCDFFHLGREVNARDRPDTIETQLKKILQLFFIFDNKNSLGQSDQMSLLKNA
jgi:hypothetical protein